MKSYKCDLCLEYCEVVFACINVIFYTMRNSKRVTREIKELCLPCWEKLNDWVDENAVVYNIMTEGGNNT